MRASLEISPYIFWARNGRGKSGSMTTHRRDGLPKLAYQTVGRQHTSLKLTVVAEMRRTTGDTSKDATNFVKSGYLGFQDHIAPNELLYMAHSSPSQLSTAPGRAWTKAQPDS